MHKAEVEMRHELGVETILFGRDYPHPEGTWPNTREWLRDAFGDVPADELRLMLGENAIRFWNLDRPRLGEIAWRIGPTIDDIQGKGPVIRPELIRNFDERGGYLKPPEGGARLDMVDEMIQEVGPHGRLRHPLRLTGRQNTVVAPGPRSTTAVRKPA